MGSMWSTVVCLGVGWVQSSTVCVGTALVARGPEVEYDGRALGIAPIPADSLIEEDAELLSSLLCRIRKGWKAVAGFVLISLVVLAVVLVILAVSDAARASILATIGIHHRSSGHTVGIGMAGLHVWR